MSKRETAWYAVRCCCQPTKIFGFIQLHSKSQMQNVLDNCGYAHTVELKAMQEVAPIRLDRERPPMQAELTVQKELAIYSDDRPIEFWRTIPGFLEVKYQ